MSTTPIHDPPQDRNIWVESNLGDLHSDEQSAVARENQTRTAEEQRDAEGMVSPEIARKSAAQLCGLLAPSADDIEPAGRLIWWADELGHPAKLLAVWLAQHACQLSGEVIVDAYDAIYFGNFSDDEAFVEAAGDLVRSGALEYCWLRNGLVLARFPIDDDDYYGSDDTLPADWDAPLHDRDDYLFEYEIDQAVRPQTKDPRRQRIYDKTSGRCFYCIAAWAEHLDHMHPKSRDGGDDEDNLIGACTSCNSQKRDRTVEEYRALLAYQRRLPEVRMVVFFGEADQ